MLIPHRYWLPIARRPVWGRHRAQPLAALPRQAILPTAWPPSSCLVRLSSWRLSAPTLVSPQRRYVGMLIRMDVVIVSRGVGRVPAPIAGRFHDHADEKGPASGPALYQTRLPSWRQ